MVQRGAQGYCRKMPRRLVGAARPLPRPHGWTIWSAWPSVCDCSSCERNSRERCVSRYCFEPASHPLHRPVVDEALGSTSPAGVKAATDSRDRRLTGCCAQPVLARCSSSRDSVTRLRDLSAKARISAALSRTDSASSMRHGAPNRHSVCSFLWLWQRRPIGRPHVGGAAPRLGLSDADESLGTWTAKRQPQNFASGSRPARPGYGSSQRPPVNE